MAEMNVIIVLVHTLLVRNPDCELDREVSGQSSESYWQHSGDCCNRFTISLA